MYKNFRERGIPRLLRLPQGGAVFDFRGAVAVLTVPHRDIPYTRRENMIGNTTPKNHVTSSMVAQGEVGKVSPTTKGCTTRCNPRCSGSLFDKPLTGNYPTCEQRHVSPFYVKRYQKLPGYTTSHFQSRRLPHGRSLVGNIVRK